MNNNKSLILLLLFAAKICSVCYAQQTQIQFLSGKDKDNTVNWDFMCTNGRNSAKWTKIPVPSNWEMEGFGNYAYYKDNKEPEQGFYKFTFRVPSSHREKKIKIVFEASMTDTEVKVNGMSAGEIHQGGFYEFKYDITDLIKFDTDNLLEVKVSRHSSNESVNRAERKSDFWLFGGIYRPVYLEMVPYSHIERVAIDAGATGDMDVHVFTENVSGQQTIEVSVQDLKGKTIESPFSLRASDHTILSHHFGAIETWNPEKPHLYNAIISIKQGAKTIHTIKQRFGFRTAELRPRDGFYVNGVKVIFKGVNRHSEWPESGRSLSRRIHLMDIALMKEMNMNAVRMSHYPPDKEFLDLCDSLGLFVLDELTGWQAAYDTTVGRKLVKELVIRDVNHPSIVIWDNGNEGGWNRALDNDYQLYDPQRRLVIHPWEKFNGTNTKHYPEFNAVTNSVLYGTDVFFPTEFMHGLFDGGHGAALEDFWNEMMKHPYAAGGFLWSFHDEGIVRTDKNDSIDVAGNSAPDGIVGPHREKEGSFYTIRSIWSPIQIPIQTLSQDFDGKLPVINRYLYTNLNECRFEWKIVKFPVAMLKSTTGSVLLKGTIIPSSLLPNDTGVINFTVNKAFKEADALYLTAYNAAGKAIMNWSWAIHSPNQIAEKANRIVSNHPPVSIKVNDTVLTVTCDHIVYGFDKKTGFLKNVFNGRNISFNNGPSLAGVPLTLVEFKTLWQDDAYIIEPIYKDLDHFKIKWTFKRGKLPQLDYQYTIDTASDFAGITFNYPEQKIRGMKWLGRGPYHVWKNRLPGQQLGVWKKDYNNTVTGQSWNYPEFKGWHSQLYWVTVQNEESDFTVYSRNEGVYFQMLQPDKPAASGNNYTSPAFPGNTIGFFNAVSPIGTKFQNANVMGPQSQKNPPVNPGFAGILLFDFRGGGAVRSDSSLKAYSF